MEKRAYTLTLCGYVINSVVKSSHFDVTLVFEPRYAGDHHVTTRCENMHWSEFSDIRESVPELSIDPGLVNKDWTEVIKK